MAARKFLPVDMSRSTMRVKRLKRGYGLWISDGGFEVLKAMVAIAQPLIDIETLSQGGRIAFKGRLGGERPLAVDRNCRPEGLEEWKK